MILERNPITNIPFDLLESNMPNLQTLLVYPLMVAVFTLVIEYCVILPTRERLTSKNNPSNSEVSPILLMTIGKYLLIVTGFFAFLFAVFVILGGLEVDLIKFGVKEINNPFNYMLSNSFLSDQNVTTAAIIYACLGLNIISFQEKSPSWAKPFTLVILPSALLILWATMFYYNDPLVLFGCLLASNFWIIGCYLGSFGFKEELYSKRDKTPIVYLGIFLFPINALFLIFIGKFSPGIAWPFAIAILICQYFWVNWPKS